MAEQEGIVVAKKKRASKHLDIAFNEKALAPSSRIRSSRR